MAPSRVVRALKPGGGDGGRASPAPPVRPDHCTVAWPLPVTACRPSPGEGSWKKRGSSRLGAQSSSSTATTRRRFSATSAQATCSSCWSARGQSPRRGQRSGQRRKRYSHGQRLSNSFVQTFSQSSDGCSATRSRHGQSSLAPRSTLSVCPTGCMSPPSRARLISLDRFPPSRLARSSTMPATSSGPTCRDGRQVRFTTRNGRCEVATLSSGWSQIAALSPP